MSHVAPKETITFTLEDFARYAQLKVDAERERCAKIADARAAFWGKNGEEVAAAAGREIAARIRRGE